MNILIINAGSSSIKYKLFAQQQVIVSGLIEGIGEASGYWHHQFSTKTSSAQHFADHQQAFTALSAKLHQELPHCHVDGVGHRVVHGGIDLYQPTVIDQTVLAQIKQLSSLAPIHNPVNVLGIIFAMQYYPDACHVAIFDSGFHHSMPNHVSHYAIEQKTAAQYQIRRYGFHGINHEYVAQQAAAFLNKPLAQCNLISLHLGNGASACLIKQGKSSDTSMGMTPLAGLVMGTRCGDIDPAIVLYLLEQGMSAQDIDRLLNKQSGLKGIAGDNDMRHVLSRSEAGDEEANVAIDMFVYSIQKTIGAYLSQLPELDGLIFTGGIGENATAIRQKIMTPLQHLGFYFDDQLNANQPEKHIWPLSQQGHLLLVVRGDEEAFMAEKVSGVMAQLI